MVALRTWLRPGAALLILAGVLGLGCGGGNKEPSGYSRVEGTITYDRLPVNYVAGVPSGLGATAVTTPARGVQVKVFQLFQDLDPYGNRVPTWRLGGVTYTDSNGHYAFSGATKTGYPTFVEVDSVWRQDGGDGATVKVVADPAGIASTTPEPDRPIYVLRQDPAGQLLTVTDPVANPGVVAALSGDIQINFPLGNSTAGPGTWAVTVPEWYASGSQPVSQTEVQPLGGRVLAILDSAYYFSYYYGDPTPATVKGGVLDLHYYPGRTETPRRSYVVQDPTLLSAYTYDGTAAPHYFGTLAGGPAVDDAWDPGVLYALFARNNLAGWNKTTLYPYGQDRTAALVPDLAPDLALVEGLGDAMAATLIRTPYITDVSSATALAGRDIRVASPGGIYSPANLAALAWRLTVTLNGAVRRLDASQIDTPAAWATLDPTSLRRFFQPVYPTETIATTSGNLVVRKDVASIFGQVQVLYDHNDDTVHLDQYFNDLNLIPMLSLFGIDWPGTNAWANLATYWGLAPGGAMPAMSLQLDPNLARQVPDPDPIRNGPDLYLNTSHQEVAYARLDFVQDQTYQVSLTTTPATLPTGVQVELAMEGKTQEALLFSAADSAAKAWVFKGNPNDPSNPARRWVRIRLLSQDPALSATPIQVVVNLAKVPPAS